MYYQIKYRSYCLAAEAGAQVVTKVGDAVGRALPITDALRVTQSIKQLHAAGIRGDEGGFALSLDLWIEPVDGPEPRPAPTVYTRAEVGAA